jgi:hypothetical protein
MRTMGHKDVKTAMQYQHPEPRDRARCARSGHSSRETGVAGLSLRHTLRHTQNIDAGGVNRAEAAKLLKRW